MNNGPSGFHNAPVTRTFVIACTILTIFIGMQGRSSSLGLANQDIFKKLRLWRLISSIFAFSSTPELMFGIYLLYYFRVFERQIGSNKYSVFILLSVILTALFEAIALLLLKDPSVGILAPGPYGLIFASFIPFYFDIPVTTRFRIFGIHFSDKSFIYLAGLQLLLSSWKRSLLPGICGVLAGISYRLNVFGIRRIKFPEFVASFFSRLSWPSSSALTGNPTGNVPSHTGRQIENIY
ncbi:rhomboid-like protein 20 isoform X2 [Amborella trichopoda]|uniref:rhomboid-like protein 20 isoform X2 n=1 Tax=Amborella trichopoda TaxID=13333 RepID=UPI0005D44E53|nr:rhomboid-like protein 20 isoform X2 [Amborella trichopoda]|eukprot:XP_011620740.1 rhomboid-like protein 20 isoform X2 [Amborella trichopoda]